MKPSETLLGPASYIGHVKNGVVVLDGQVSLNEGQTVRVEPLGDANEKPRHTEDAERVRQLQQLFAEWTEEDGKLPAEEADRLRTALEMTGRLSFRSPTLD